MRFHISEDRAGSLERTAQNSYPIATPGPHQRPFDRSVALAEADPSVACSPRTALAADDAIGNLGGHQASIDSRCRDTSASHATGARSERTRSRPTGAAGPRSCVDGAPLAQSRVISFVAAELQTMQLFGRAVMAFEHWRLDVSALHYLDRSVNTAITDHRADAELLSDQLHVVLHVLATQLGGGAKDGGHPGIGKGNWLIDCRHGRRTNCTRCRSSSSQQCSAPATISPSQARDLEHNGRSSAIDAKTRSRRATPLARLFCFRCWWRGSQRAGFASPARP